MTETFEDRPELTDPRIEERELAAWRALLNAHALVVRRIEADLQAEGLPSLGWYDVLWALYRSPGRRLRIHELADEVVLSRTGMSRLVDRIEAAGMLRREPVPDDRRGAYAVVTEEGIELLRRMWPVYARGIRELFAQQLGDDPDPVRATLERVAERARPEARST
jgi:DNA-binding MarR family transcriptional regulator